MFQNRVNPLGEIIKTTARGTLFGNRGVIHNNKGEITRPYKVKAWIACLLQFKGRRFVIMAPKRFTGLFFLDEATAYAAGHRPCNECRRDDFRKFKSSWIKGNPEYGFDMKTKIAEIDQVIHNERIDAKGNKVTFEMNTSEIPDGTFVLFNSTSYLAFQSKLHEWTPFGYKEVISIPSVSAFTVLTPLSIVKAFRAGLVPVMKLGLK